METVECKFRICGNNCGGVCLYGGCRMADLPRPPDEGETDDGGADDEDEDDETEGGER